MTPAPLVQKSSSALSKTAKAVAELLACTVRACYDFNAALRHVFGHVFPALDAMSGMLFLYTMESAQHTSAEVLPML